MVDSTSIPNAVQDPSPDRLDKDVEIQTIHSESDDNGEGGEESSGKDEKFLSMTAKGDIEAYPVGSNEGKEAPVTRTSTKSSWKDPGPPPDGGAGAWTQGKFIDISNS
jgi:hypothetical protein